MLKFIINCRVCGLDEEVEADSEEVAKIGFREHHKTVSPSCPAPCFSCEVAPPEEYVVLPPIVIGRIRRRDGPISLSCP